MSSMLIASGLDPSGGAGFIADVRAAELAGVRPIGVLTALTVQDTRGVRRAVAVDPELLGEQLAAVLSDVEVDAVKIGLVADAASATVVAGGLALTGAAVIWDPVVTATAGGSMTSDSLAAISEHLAAESTLVTPNLIEASELLGRAIERREQMDEAALELSERLGCAVLLKGGHLAADEPPADVVARSGTVRAIVFERIEGPPVHGTGCFLSSAIAAELALGLELDAAIDAGRARLMARLAAPVVPGRGSPSVL